MKILLGMDVIESYTGSSNKKMNSLIGAIIFNSAIRVSFSKTYIDLIEAGSENIEMFRAMIKELNDENRLCIEKCEKKLTADVEFKEIYLKSSDSIIIPIILEDRSNFIATMKSLLVLNGIKKINKNWILTEILSKNICNVCYQDFQNNAAVETFFNDVFSIFRYLKEVQIYDREQCATFLGCMKGFNIKYYTYSPNKNRVDGTTKASLKGALGGKLKLYITTNPRILHERKILIENLIITSDNSRNNLTIDEPTWEITISLDAKKSKKWVEKAKSFREVA